MLVSHSNPIIWISDICKAMSEGWKLKPEVSDGHPSTAFYYELKLFKGWTQEYTVCKDANFLVEEYDAMKFLQGCQEAVLNGFELIVESVRFDSIGIKRAVFENPNFVNPTKYTKEMLDNLDWNEIRKVGKHFDCFNRNRDIMTNKILEAQSKVIEE